MLPQSLPSDGSRFWARLRTPFASDDLLEKQYQRSRANGKERMLTIFLVVMSIMTVAQVPFFELEDPVQVFRMGSFLLIYIYTCLLRALFHCQPTLSLYWDYFVFLGAMHMILSYSLSHDRVAKLLGDEYHGDQSRSCEPEIYSQVSIASVLLGVGLLLKIRWQFFAALAILAPTCYFVVGTIFGRLGCESGAPHLEMGAVHITGLGLLILIGVMLNENDRRRLWDSCRDSALLMARLRIAHSLRERLLRAVFDVSFAAQITPSGDLQVVGEWPALDHLMGSPTADTKLSSHMPSSDRDRFLDYVRRAVNNTDEANPACLLSVHFEPEAGRSLAANMYIVSTAGEPVLTVCLSTRVAEGNDCDRWDSHPLVAEKGAMAAASALAARIKNMTPEQHAKGARSRPPPPSLHSAPTELLRIKPEARLLTACEDDCLRPDSVAWVEGQPLPQALNTLSSGQKVLCHDSVTKGLRYAEILDVRTENGNAKWVDVVLEDGTSLQMTANHPVLPLTGNQSSSAGAVRAMDLCPGSDYLMVLKTMPVLVQEILSSSDSESEDRVFLTLHQPQRHSLFVASAPSSGTGQPAVRTMAVGSADVHPRYDIPSKNTFVDIPEHLAVPVLKRSNSAPPDYLEAKLNPTIVTTSSASYISSKSDSSIAPPSEDAEILFAPPKQPVWRATASLNALSMEPRHSGGAVALSEVLSIHSVSVRSLGSIGHAHGVCKTCLFANRAYYAGGVSCTKGIFCERCHEEHDPVERRKAKTGRQRERSKLMLL